MHYIIGIDEAGRGPWAGPIVAGGFMIQMNLIEKIPLLFPFLNDSKKLTEKQREGIYGVIEYLSHQNECQFTFAYREADRIDEVGIREANRECMEDIILSFLQYIYNDDTVEIWIDGCDNYRFSIDDFSYFFAKKKPRQSSQKFNNGGKKKQGNTDGVTTPAYKKEGIDVTITETEKYGKKTISYLINGDTLHPTISLASIVAKVIRDRMMCEYNEDFPLYSFGQHKGYGTRKHHDAIINYGITSLHRKSYAPVKRLISPPSSI